MKYCSHIEQFCSNLNNTLSKCEENNEENNYNNNMLDERLKQICSILIQFNQNFSSKKSHNNFDFETNIPKHCQDCLLTPLNQDLTSSLTNRIFLCAECLYIACFNFQYDSYQSHMRQHSIMFNHLIIIDMVYSNWYCIQCRDFQYNQTIENSIRKYFLKDNFFPYGKSLI